MKLLKDNIEKYPDNLKKTIEETEYFACFSDFDLHDNTRLNFLNAEVQVHRFTRPNEPKQCTIKDRDAWLSLDDHHVIFPCCHWKKRLSSLTRKGPSFLSTYSKSLGEVDFSACRDAIFLLTVDNKEEILKIKLSRFDNTKKICDGYEIDDQEFAAIQDTSMVFLDDCKTLVGCYKKAKKDDKINLYIFGENGNLLYNRLFVSLEYIFIECYCVDRYHRCVEIISSYRTV